MSSELVRTITVPKVIDDGALVFAQTPDQIPFPIQRIYWILDADPAKARGAHTHKENRQLLFCTRGSINIALDDGNTKEEVFLDQPEVGVLLEPLVWHEMHGFRRDTVLTVLASHRYDPDDYIRDYQKFLDYLKQPRH